MKGYSLFQGKIIVAERQYVDNLPSLIALDLNFNQTWASLGIFSNEGPHHFPREELWNSEKYVAIKLGTMNPWMKKRLPFNRGERVK